MTSDTRIRWANDVLNSAIEEEIREAYNTWYKTPITEPTRGIMWDNAVEVWEIFSAGYRMGKLGKDKD